MKRTTMWTMIAMVLVALVLPARAALVATTGGTMKGPLLSTSSSTNAPATNEMVTAWWVAHNTTSSGGGNMTNTGAAVVGMIPVATDTTGHNWTPTNQLPSLNVGTLNFLGGTANIVPVWDANTNLVASRTTTNQLDYLSAIYSDLATALTNKVLKTGDTMTGTLNLNPPNYTGTNALSLATYNPLGNLRVVIGSDTWQAGTGSFSGNRSSGSSQLQMVSGTNTVATIILVDANGWSGTTISPSSIYSIASLLFGSSETKLTATYVDLNASQQLYWRSGANIFAGSPDLYLTRDSAATLQLGLDSATAVSQSVKAADGSGSDKVGGGLTIEGGQSTGTAVAGKVDIATGLSGEASASTANAYSIRAHYKPKFVALGDNSATEIEKFSLAANKILGGELLVTTYATNSTPHLQCRTTALVFQAVAVSTTITGTIDVVKAGTLAASTGTMTEAYTLVDNGDNTFSIKLQADSDLTSPTDRCKVVVTALNGNDAVTITDP